MTEPKAPVTNGRRRLPDQGEKDCSFTFGPSEETLKRLQAQVDAIKAKRSAPVETEDIPHGE